jgi:hypothetical protein
VVQLAQEESEPCSVRVEELTENQNTAPTLYSYTASTDCKAVANGLKASGYTEDARLHSDQSSASDQGYFWLLSPNSPDGAPATDAGVYALYPNTPQIAASIATPGPIPLGIVVNHARTFVYATIQGVPSGQTGIPAHPPEIVAISTASLSITQTINLPQGVNPGTPVLSPDDRYLYVPSDGTSPGVFVVDTENTASITGIPVTIIDRSGNTVAENVNQGAITPDGELLFVTESGSAGGGVYVIDTLTQQQTGSATFFNPITSLPPLGTCTMYSGGVYDGFVSTAFFVPQAQPLDGGSALQVTSGSASESVTPTSGVPQFYESILGQLPTLTGGSPLFFNFPGTFTLSIPGGANVQHTQVQGTTPTPLQWTNRASLPTTLNRANGLTITWSGGDPATDVALIGTWANNDAANSAAMVICVAPITAGSFTIPSQILATLPPTPASAVRVPAWIGLASAPLLNPGTFSAGGLNAGFLIPSAAFLNAVVVQ